MLPTPKGPGDHHVAKHTSRFVSSVLGRPGLHQWAGAQSNLHSRSWLFDRARAFNDAGIFPGRSEQRERVGLSVPGINNVRGRGHLAAINKQFAHKLTSSQAMIRDCRRRHAISAVIVLRLRGWSAPTHRTAGIFSPRHHFSSTRPRKPAKRSWYIPELPQHVKSEQSLKFLR